MTKKLACPICGKRCADADALARHINYAHNKRRRAAAISSARSAH